MSIKTSSKNMSKAKPDVLVAFCIGTAVADDTERVKGGEESTDHQKKTFNIYSLVCKLLGQYLTSIVA